MACPPFFLHIGFGRGLIEAKLKTYTRYICYFFYVTKGCISPYRILFRYESCTSFSSSKSSSHSHTMSRFVDLIKSSKTKCRINLGNSILSQEPSGPKMQSQIPVKRFHRDIVFLGLIFF